MKHEFSIKIESKTVQEADDKMEALVILASKLTGKELAGLANVVKNDPAKTALAKRYLNL